MIEISPRYVLMSRKSLTVILLLTLGRAGIAQEQPLLATFTPPTSKTILPTTFVDWDALVARDTPQAVSRPIFDNPTAGMDKLGMHSTALKPGMTLHAPHHHAAEELLLIKEGEVFVSINGKKHRAGPGYLIFFASHDAHGIENLGDKNALYYVMNIWPPAARTTPDKPAAEQNVPGKLPSSVIDCESVTATPTASGSVATICDSPTLTFSRLASRLITLNADQSVTIDTADGENALFFVKAGGLEANVKQVANRMTAGSFFYCAPNEKVSLKNTRTTPAVYQEIRIMPGPAK